MTSLNNFESLSHHHIRISGGIKHDVILKYVVGNPTGVEFSVPRLPDDLVCISLRLRLVI